MDQYRIRIDPGVSALVTVGLVEVRGIAGAVPGSVLDEEIARETSALRARFEGLSAGEIPHLSAARELYRAIGLDPTKRRPSPEALLRRLLRGDPFPRVHPAVDLGNLWAVLHGLPVGLYDTARLEGPIVLRLGRAGERYEGIRKDDVHLDGRLLLADDAGPFGNPSSDSLRTSVDGKTRDLLYVLFAPCGYDAGEIARWLAWLSGRAVRDLGGSASTG